MFLYLHGMHYRLSRNIVNELTTSKHTSETICTTCKYSAKLKIEFVSSMINMHASYGTAKKKRPCYLVGNLVATNWPIEKALHAIGYNQIPTK